MSDTLRKYDRWSRIYDGYDNPMVNATAWVLDRHPLACTGRDVLELGCGTGRHVARLLEAGARTYVGLDGSPGMLAVARRRYPDPRVRFIEGDLDGRLPFAEASFDCVLIVLVLEHLRALGELFGELARVLRPGGDVRIVELHPGLIASGTAAHFRDGGGEVRFESFVHPTAALAAALEQVGLAPCVVRELAADGELLRRVPKLAKHARRPVLLDLEVGRVQPGA